MCVLLFLLLQTYMEDTSWSSGHCFISTVVAKTSRLATKKIEENIQLF